MDGRRWYFALLFALLLSAPAAFAQTVGSIEGTVTDTTKGALPGATVQVTNENTGITRSVVTDAEGRYRARDLSLGQYRIETSLQGFQSSARRGVVLTIGREAVVDFELAIGELSETLEVTGDAPLVNTTSGAMTSLVAREQMADLPLNARDFSQLISLQAGTVNHANTNVGGGGGGGAATGARISINGARPSSNVFILDGTDVQTAHGQLPAGVGGAQLGLEAVQEFKIQTSNYSAQYGRSVGGTVVAATRSGTNDLHGSAYWYNRDDRFDARNFFDSEKPDFKRNQFGASLGGRIIRNRTFFFANFEGLRERLPRPLRAVVPTAAAREGILPGRTVTVAPAVKPYLALYPLPNGRDFGDGTADYVRSARQPTDQDYTSIRVDHQFTSNSSIFGRYTRDMSDVIDPQTIALVDNARYSRNQIATIEQKQMLSARFFNQVRVGYTRTSVGSDPLTVVELDPSLSFYAGRRFGTINVSGLSGLDGGGGTTGSGHDSVNTVQMQDDATWDAGRHSIHFGGAFTLMQMNRVSNSREGGAWDFANLAEFLQNRPPTRMRIMGFSADAERLFRQRLLAVYAQDDIKLRSNLTLNVGLRYEYMTVPTESEGRLSNMRNVLDKATTVGEFYEQPGGFFSPRLGLAWDPTGAGTTSVRMGVGVFHEPLMMKAYINAMSRQLPFWSDVDATPADLVGLFPDLNSSLERLTREAPQATHTFQFNPNNPYSIQGSLSVQRMLAANLVVEVGYATTRGVHLLAQNEWAAPERSVVDGETFFAPDAQYVNPAFTRLNYYDTSASSWYHALKTTVTKRLSAGLHFQGAYTFSKTLDTNSASIAGELVGSAHTMDVYDTKRDWGPAGFHVPHVFSGSVSYHLPWGSGLQGIAGAFARGWQVSSIVTAMGGVPFTVLSNAQLTHPLKREGARPDLIPGGNHNPVLGGPELYFDPSQFVPQRPGFYGNVGRNTLVGPGLVKLDLSLAKKFALGGARNLEVRAEVFNVTNRANFGLPSTTLFNVRGARLTAAGRITNTITTARQGQVAIRFAF